MNKDIVNEKMFKEKEKYYKDERKFIKKSLKPSANGEVINIDTIHNYIKNLDISLSDKLFLKMILVHHLVLRNHHELATRTLKTVIRENSELKDPFIKWEIEMFNRNRTLLKNKRK